MTPETMTLTLRRNVPFAEEFDFTDDEGDLIDFTGYTGALQIRLYGAQPGTALISLASVNTDVEGVRLLDANTWKIRIDEASIDALPDAAEAGGEAAFVFDWVLNDGLIEDVWVEGPVTVKPGVTA